MIEVRSIFTKLQPVKETILVPSVCRSSPTVDSNNFIGNNQSCFHPPFVFFRQFAFWSSDAILISGMFDLRGVASHRCIAFFVDINALDRVVINGLKPRPLISGSFAIFASIIGIRAPTRFTSVHIECQIKTFRWDRLEHHNFPRNRYVELYPKPISCPHIIDGYGRIKMIIVWQEVERILKATLWIYWRAEHAIFADRGRPPLITRVSSWNNPLFEDAGWSPQITFLCIVVAAR